MLGTYIYEQFIELVVPLLPSYAVPGGLAFFIHLNRSHPSVQVLSQSSAEVSRSSICPGQEGKMVDNFMRMNLFVVRLKNCKKIKIVRKIKKNKVSKQNAGINCSKVN